MICNKQANESQQPTRRVAWSPRGLLALCGGTCALAFAALTAVPAGGDTGPQFTSIPSPGGYHLCLNNILSSDRIHRFRSVQGTRHPYKAAAYKANNSVAGLSPLISNDNQYSWNEAVQPTGDIRKMRVDNRAASSGNGQYRCESLGV